MGPPLSSSMSPEEFLKAMRDASTEAARQELCMSFLLTRVEVITPLDGKAVSSATIRATLEGSRDLSEGEEIWDLRLDRYGTSTLCLHRRALCDRCKGTGEHPEILEEKELSDWVSIGDVMSSKWVPCVRCDEGWVYTREQWAVECENKPVHEPLPDMEFDFDES